MEMCDRGNQHFGVDNIPPGDHQPMVIRNLDAEAGLMAKQALLPTATAC